MTRAQVRMWERKGEDEEVTEDDGRPRSFRKDKGRRRSEIGAGSARIALNTIAVQRGKTPDAAGRHQLRSLRQRDARDRWTLGRSKSDG